MKIEDFDLINELKQKHKNLTDAHNLVTGTQIEFDMVKKQAEEKGYKIKVSQEGELQITE